MGADSRSGGRVRSGSVIRYMGGHGPLPSTIGLSGPRCGRCSGMVVDQRPGTGLANPRPHARDAQVSRGNVWSGSANRRRGVPEHLRVTSALVAEGRRRCDTQCRTPERVGPRVDRLRGP